MLSDRCPVCPVCNVGVLWPNGWMDQDKTWHVGRPRPWPQMGTKLPKRGTAASFRPMPVVAKRRASQLLLSTCSFGVPISCYTSLLCLLFSSFPDKCFIISGGSCGPTRLACGRRTGDSEWTLRQLINQSISSSVHVEIVSSIWKLHRRRRSFACIA